jgi:alpha-galactosidase
MKRADGTPLPSNEVTFGGWRYGSWFALDGTHRGAQGHLESLFRTMRREWGCTYFKLDANFWGAMHGGRFHDVKATRIEAYRRGMEAILRGAENSFILGCNHPIWPSFGLIDGSRSSGDIKRTWAVRACSLPKTWLRIRRNCSSACRRGLWTLKHSSTSGF